MTTSANGIEFSQINNRLKEILQLITDCEDNEQLDKLEAEALFLKEALKEEDFNVSNKDVH